MPILSSSASRTCIHFRWHSWNSCQIQEFSKNTCCRVEVRNLHYAYYFIFIDLISTFVVWSLNFELLYEKFIPFRNVKNGAVLARSSQPEVGWLGWRSPEDEALLKALSDACSYDRGESTMINSPINYSDTGSETVTANNASKKVRFEPLFDKSIFVFFTNHNILAESTNRGCKILHDSGSKSSERWRLWMPWVLS